MSALLEAATAEGGSSMVEQLNCGGCCSSNLTCREYIPSIIPLVVKSPNTGDGQKLSSKGGEQGR